MRFTLQELRPRYHYQSFMASVRTVPCVETVQSSDRKGGAGSPSLL